MSSNPTHLLSNKNNVGSHMPFCNPPKNPIFITTVSTSVLSLSLYPFVPQKKYPILFFPRLFPFPHNRIMWALLGFISWSEFHRENREGENLFIFSFPSLSVLFLSLFIVLSSYPLSLSLLHYFNRTRLCGLSFQVCLLPFVASVLDLR